MQSLYRDLIFGFRVLRRSKAYAAIAVLTLALGVGATSAIFSIVNGLLLNSLPWSHPESIVSFDILKLKADARARAATPAQYHDFKQQSASFADMVALRFDQASLTDRDDPYLAFAPRVTTNALAVAGIQPLLGRGFDAADGLPGARPVVILSERLFKQRYGGDPRLVGGEIEVNGEPTAVIGVLAADRWFPFPQADLLQPLSLAGESPSRTDQRLAIVARLKPDVSVAQAQAEVDLITQRLARQYPETDVDLSARLELTRERLVGARGRTGVLLLMGAVGFVLLIVCANLASLLLARASSRAKEIATRAAIGASRGQIVRQLLLECTAIAVLALPLALLVTRGCLDYFLSLVPSNLSFMDQFFRFDATVLLFALSITLATVILFGLWPAITASRVDLSTSLKDGGARGGTEAGSQRLRSALVVVQLGLALSLLVAASLFMQAFANVSRADTGFRVDGLFAATFVLPESRYGDAEKLRALQGELSAALKGLPDGARAAIASDAPFDPASPYRDFQIAGRETAGREEAPRARWSSVSPEYFAVVGLKVLKGRELSHADDVNAQPVAVITRSLAEQFFPDRDPIGQRLQLSALDGFGAVNGGTREIIGVVSDFHSFEGLRAPEAQPRIYEAQAQQPTNLFEIVVRGADDSLRAAATLRRRAEGVDSQLRVGRIESMRTRFDRQLWQGRFFYTLMAILGGVALLLSAVGVYGVVSYSTARRKREFGIRAALGCEPRQIATLVLSKTLVLASLGLGFGLLLATVLSRALQVLLYDVSPRDPATLVAVALFLLLVTIVASLAPVLRAIRASPMDSLRVE